MSGREVTKHASVTDLGLSGDIDRFSRLTLEQLFGYAEQFGRVYIFSSDSAAPPECYSATIEFNSIPGVALKATSEFKLPLSFALMQAIDRAEQVAATYGERSAKGPL